MKISNDKQLIELNNGEGYYPLVFCTPEQADFLIREEIFYKYTKLGMPEDYTGDLEDLVFDYYRILFYDKEDYENLTDAEKEAKLKEWITEKSNGLITYD